MASHLTFPDYLVAQQVAEALSEDLNNGCDWTASLIDSQATANAKITANQAMVVCGQPWVTTAFKLCDPNCEIEWLVTEGQLVTAGNQLCIIRGNARGLLTAERTALNFMQTLAATATITRQYVELIKDTTTLILDTRKTIPGLRLAQKYAVRVGGGANQRIGLNDGVLIKENHIIAHGGISQVLSHAWQTIPKHIPIQIEVENEAELHEAVAAGARLILLDNMSLTQIKACVDYCRGKNVELEVSGNVDLTTVCEYALTGVQRISIGSLTKHIRAIDLSLRFF